MDALNQVKDSLPPDVWAIYIVGVITVFIAVWQYKSKFKLSKKAKVFEGLSGDIQTATELVNKINNDSEDIIKHLASAANLASANFDAGIRTQPEINDEIARRMQEINDTASKHEDLLETIFSSYKEVLELIKNVEMSTVVGKKSKKAARYLFYAADAQFRLVNNTLDVLRSFSVSPALGDKPNISSDTFNAFIGLMREINAQNQTTVTYLEDLEVVLHNDLVRGIYGKALYSTIPVKHLTPEGLTDKRVNDSLL